jgi:hypothetical protein
MRLLNSLHDDLSNILNEYSTWFFGNKVYERLDPLLGPETDSDDPTSVEYLLEAMEDPVRYGFPRQSLAMCLEKKVDLPRKAPKDVLDKTSAFTDSLVHFLGARHSALAMYYPPGGYIGWHHNGNAPGYNLILTINEQADGEFELYNMVDESFQTYPDKDHWTGKVGYFGDVFKKEELCWHTARSRGHRLTMSFVIYDKNIWDHMIEDIER